MNRLVLAHTTMIYGAVFLGFWARLSLQIRDLDPSASGIVSVGEGTAPVWRGG